MTDIAPPPATGVWYDVDATALAVLHILRLQGGDVDAARIRELIPTAAQRIDVYCDRTTVLDGPPPPAHIQHALEQLTVDRYLRNSPNPTNLGAFPFVDDETRLLDALIPGERQRWGVA